MIGIFLIIGACCLWAIDTLIRYPLLGSGVNAERIVFTEHLYLAAIFLPYIYSKREKIWSSQISAENPYKSFAAPSASMSLRSS